MSTSKICLIIIKKSANIRSNRVPVEDKKKHHKEAMKRWQQKEYKCSKCGETYKNSYRVVHNKICKQMTRNNNFNDPGLDP